VAVSRWSSPLKQAGGCRGDVTTGASEVKSHRRRGKTTPTPRVGKTRFRRGVHAPMSIHQSGWSVVKRLLLSRVEPAGAQTPEGEKQGPLETHEMRVHVTAVRLASIGRFHPDARRLRRESQPEGSTGAPWTVRTRGDRAKR